MAQRLGGTAAQAKVRRHGLQDGTAKVGQLGSVAAQAAMAALQDGEGGQLDLVIDRRDQTINLCEMKFSQGEFEITKAYDTHLRERAERFRASTKTRKALHQTFVTTYGLKQNRYSGNVQSEVKLDDLFVG